MNAQHLTPILNVSNMEQSFDWFTRLGWTKRWDWQATPDAPITFGAVGSGQCEIFLCLGAQGGSGQVGDREMGMWMSMWVAKVDAEFANCQANGIEVTRPPKDEPWGVREMHVRHPDGHIFRISQSSDCPEPA